VNREGRVKKLEGGVTAARLDKVLTEAFG